MGIIKNDYDRKYYENIISTNHYAIFNIFTADPANVKDNIVHFLGGEILKDDLIEVKVKLDRKYKGEEEVVFNIYISESSDSYSIEVKVEGVLSFYEKINQTYISKREINK